MRAERIVLDTNVLISGVLFTRSVPGKVVERSLTRGRVLVSGETLAELRSKLLSPKFDRYVSSDLREAFLIRFEAVAETVYVHERIRVCRDPADDKFLEVAISGRATVLVTGDQDLLAVHPFRGIGILGPSEFLGREE